MYTQRIDVEGIPIKVTIVEMDFISSRTYIIEISNGIDSSWNIQQRVSDRDNPALFNIIDAAYQKGVRNESK